MNISMVNLSIQLVLYAAAWLAVGISVKLHRQASLSWALSWLLTAAASAMLVFKPAFLAGVLDPIVNTLVMSAFIGIYGGLVRFAGGQLSKSVISTAYLGLVAIELARWLRPELTDIRVWLFTIAFSGPIAAIIGLLWAHSPDWFKRRYVAQLVLVFPAVLTLTVFLTRALVTSFYPQPVDTHLDTDSTFNLLSATAFLVFLGFFNFSLFALVLGSLIAKLDTLSSKDQLTGLNNRRIMIEQLATEHARFLRGGQPYAMVMMDLDHFKSINDRYGHLVGDDVLRGVTTRLKQAMRDSDLIARFGGEEFLLFLPNTELDGACKQAERMRAVIGAAPIMTSAGELTVTISAGVTLSRLIDVDETQVMARTDRALYLAKSQGRNCLRVG
jgi:diguanylate cyclase (GGDEF)-like protein